MFKKLLSLGLLLIFSFSVLAQEPVAIKIPDISSGQFSYAHPTDTLIAPPNSAYELLDIDIDKIGIRKKRKGYVLIADDLGSVRIAGLTQFNPAGGTRYLVNESNGVVSTWNGSDAAWTSSKTGLTAAVQTDFVVGDNILFRLGQSDNIYSYNGSSWTDEGDTNTDFPKAKMAIWTSTQRMLAANSSASPHFLWYSDSGDPQTWNRTTNAYKVGINDADGVTGLIEFTSQEVVAFTKEAMYTLNISNSDASTWTQAKIADIGCMAHRSIKQVGGDVLFLSKDGVRSVIQSAQDKKRGASLPLSYPIQDWIDKINWKHIDRSAAWVWQDKYYLSVPVDQTYNNYTLVWSKRAFESNGGIGGWTIYRNCNFHCYAEQTFANEPTKLYTGESQADGKVYEFRSLDPEDDATNDNGTTIIYKETTRRYNFAMPEKEKTFEFVEIEVLTQDTGTISIEAQVDGEGYTSLGSFSQEGNLPTLPVDLPFDLTGANIKRQKYDLEQLGRGRDIQFIIEEVTADAPAEIVNLLIVAYPEPVDYE